MGRGIWGGAWLNNGFIKSSGLGGVGYATGAGGTVTQGTNKATAVILDKPCGTITMHGAALNAGVIVSFTLTNSCIAAGDVVIIQHESGGTLGAYTVAANTTAAGSCVITFRNATAGNLTETPVLRYAIIKATAA
jgi:hypothetical protein